MVDHNSIAENIFSSSFREHFECIRDATQSSASLQQDVYVASQVVCVKKHRKTDECKCICSGENHLDQVLIRNKAVTVRKKRKAAPVSTTENSLKKSKTDEDLLESPFCVPVEEHIFVKSLKTNCSAKNKYFCVYILQSETAPNYTYCGITNNRTQRLRRHNGLIKGGAHQTRANRPWRMVAIVNGFKSISEAQSFEWSMHNPKKRKLRTPYHGVDGRMNCIRQLLRAEPWCDRFTTAPVKMTIENLTIDGFPLDGKEFLRGLENECEIHYAEDQLRLYQTENQCLSKKTLCELEMNFCKNDEYCLQN